MSIKEDFLIESLKLLVDGIAGTFGARCEVVLHDLRDFGNLQHSIIKIANGHVTNRTIGGSITDRAMRDFRKGLTNNLFINYTSMARGKRLKSSTIVFRDSRGKPIASICINLDVTDIMNAEKALQDMLKISDNDDQKEAKETFQNDFTSTLNQLADDVIKKSGYMLGRIRKKNSMEIVKQLDGQGYFLIKGAVKLLAEKLNMSQFTLYRYLRQIEGEHIKQAANIKNTDLKGTKIQNGQQ